MGLAASQAVGRLVLYDPARGRVFIWRKRLWRKRVYKVVHRITEGTVDQAMTLQESLANKGRTHHEAAPVCASIRACMNFPLKWLACFPLNPNILPRRKKALYVIALGPET